MKLTEEFVEKIQTYLKKHEYTQAELGRQVGCTGQNIGRILRMEGKSLNDEVGERLWGLVTLSEGNKTETEELPIFHREPKILEATYTGSAMRPVVENGQKLCCSVEKKPGEGDLVVVSMRNPDRTVCRFYHNSGGKIHLVPYSRSGVMYKLDRGDIDWIAKVIIPCNKIDTTD